ncbi:3',5'-cyclic adenosine monophosphate phosphodiesterase CpdA [Allostella sp. ATCC 35155]|nr:3',5'-cyclic adenosine monophosphate phosphodiesterase CpdA [Stella sp. ATCC 35155]
MLIAQLSDPHVRPEGVLYQGVADSNRMLEAAIDRLHGLDPRPDVLVLTGDLVDEGLPEEYAAARAILDRLEIPLRLLPGNHDERRAFRDAFADRHYYLPATGPLHWADGGHGPVRVVALDVTVPGLHHGLVDAAGARWLDSTLAEEPGRPTLLLLHQPPFTCGIPYMDLYRCHGEERLAAVLRRHPQVERVACGHVHRTMQLRFAGTLLVTAPSTATQIALRLRPDAEPASHLDPPGFLLHHWLPGTGLVTHVCPVAEGPGPFPFA